MCLGKILRKLNFSFYERFGFISSNAIFITAEMYRGLSCCKKLLNKVPFQRDIVTISKLA